MSTFSRQDHSLTVNSTAGSAIAIGSIWGPQLALEEKGTVHVLWNGTGGHNASHVPLWYARKTGDTANFEKQRDLLEDSTALDGGASITADGRGGVFVVWHGNKKGAEPEESQRLVFVRRSKDSGIVFDKAQALNDTAPGVCACCSLRALAQKDGTLKVFFRGAASADHRAMTLIGNAGSAQPREIEAWKISACPMSSAALAEAGSRLIGAWETAGKIRVGQLSDNYFPPTTAALKEAKHPTIAISPKGGILIAWVEGTGWNRGGAAGWQEFDQNLKPVGNSGRTEGVPAWGRVAVYAEPEGDFVILR